MRALWISSLLLALATATGCKKATPTDAAVGDLSDPKAYLQGRWTVDLERLAKQPHLEAMPAEQRALALEMAGNVVGSMTVEFTGDHYALSMGGKTIEGGYTVGPAQGRTLTLKTTEPDGKTGELGIEVSEAGLLMRSGDGEALPLRRKK
jgi:hypothetical protein